MRCFRQDVPLFSKKTTDHIKIYTRCLYRWVLDVHSVDTIALKWKSEIKIWIVYVKIKLTEAQTLRICHLWSSGCSLYLSSKVGKDFVISYIVNIVHSFILWVINSFRIGYTSFWKSMYKIGSLHYFWGLYCTVLSSMHLTDFSSFTEWSSLYTLHTIFKTLALMLSYQETHGFKPSAKHSSLPVVLHIF